MADQTITFTAAQADAVATALQARYGHCIGKAEDAYQVRDFTAQQLWAGRAQAAASACEAMGVPY